MLAVPDRLGSTNLACSTIRRAAIRRGCAPRSRWSGGHVCRSLSRSPNLKILAGLAGSWSIGGVSGQNSNTKSHVLAAQFLTPERYVARAELAAIMGVSLATVDRMVAEGMPSVTWGRRTRRFRPSAAISWASERGKAA